MVGKIIRQERIKQKVKSKDLAAAAGVDTGHLSHIEKGIRNPSKTILAKICEELNLSYQFMLNISQNAVDEDSEAYDVTSNVPYDKVLYAENFKLMDCPKGVSGASFITKMKDESMAPDIKKGAVLYVHYTSVINPGDICLVMYNGEALVRKVNMDEKHFTLSAVSKEVKDIVVSVDDQNFNIVGTIILS
ncbi:MAG: LexA family transcriptional regulator [Clostridia bacterium]|nr:LexA family transcriptional regulator [Clostridia bacterium]